MDTFEITLQRRSGEGWPVVVEHARAQSFLPVRSEGVFCLPSDALRQAEQDAQGYGAILGQALFRDAVRDAFFQACGDSEGELHVLLSIEADELRSLRWERLCAPLDGGWRHLALDQRVPFSLYLPSLTDRRFHPFGRRDLRALLLVASPAELPEYRLEPFDVEAVVATVRAALGEIPCTVLAAVADAAGPPTLDALCERITAEPYTLLHVVCHGRFMAGDDEERGETVLYLADAQNQVEPIPASRLLQRLGGLGGARGLPHLAFLSSCGSASAAAEEADALGGLAQRLVRELGMPAVVAMTDRVSIATAEALAAGFYRRLREHGEVDRALAEASARVADRPDATVPALYSRLGGRPLFADALDRPLTAAEIEFGLSLLEPLLAERAPALRERSAAQVTKLRGAVRTSPGALSRDAQAETKQALDEINAICTEALDLGFAALALGQEPPAYDARCPFRGLFPFRDEDREFFFGRETLVGELDARLSERPFLAVVGPSGSGKSSLVLAGLLPTLRQQDPDLQTTSFTPGSDPVAQLAAALTKLPAGPAVVVVDQFEELFTLCRDDAQRRTFVDQLLALTSERRVVLTMRADFWGECAPYRALAGAMEANQKLVAPLTSAELRQVMERQAGQVGLRFEADLSNRILDDVQGEPGAMPLLQHALLELWKRRRGRWLLAAEYRALGGVQRAIARTADDLFERLAPPDQDRARDIFLRLTRLDEEPAAGGEVRDTRRRVALTELAPAGTDVEAARTLVARLADARLVVTGIDDVTGRDEVEVAHEALIRHWPRLRRWLDEDRAALRLRQDIGEAAREWERKGRDDSYLNHRGGRLAEAETLADAGTVHLNSLERAYLDACLAQRERAGARQRRLKIAVVAASLGVALISAILAGWAWSERNRAVEARQRADQQAQIAAVRAVVATGNRQRELRQDERAALLARQAFLLDQNVPASEGAERNQVDDLLRTALGVPHFSRVLSGPQGSVMAVAFSPDGTAVAAAGRDGTVRLWDPRAPGSAPTVLTADQGELLAIAYSRDDGTLATGGADGAVRLWDVAARSPRGDPLTGHNDAILTLAFSPDGGTLATGGRDGTVRLWNVGQPDTPPTVLSGQASAAFSVAFSPDGGTLAAGGADGMLRLWDLGIANAEPRVLRGEGGILAVAFGPDGRTVATGGAGGAVQLWDRERPDLAPATLAGHDGAVFAVAFGRDGMLASGGNDKTVRLWDVRAPGSPSTVLTGHEQAVSSVAFSPDGAILVSGSRDHTVRLWDVGQPSGAPTVLPGSGGDHAVVSVSRDGSVVAAGTRRDGALRLWNPDQPGAEPALLPADPTSVMAVAFGPDGRVIATGGSDKIVRLWDLRSTAAPVLSLSGHEGVVSSVAFGPDGSIVAAGSVDGTTRLWDLDAPSAPIVTLPGPPDGIASVAFGPDGETLAAGGADGTIRLWDLERLEDDPIDLRGHTAIVNAVAFSPDGRTLASGSADRTVRLWDVDSPDTPPIVLTGHAKAVKSIAFGRRADSTEDILASGGADGTLRLWDPNQPSTPPLVMLGGPEDFNSVVFTPDGLTLVTGGQDGIVRLWVAQTEALADIVCQKVWRNLTRDEWRQFVGDGIDYERTCSDLPIPETVPGATPAVDALD